MSNYLHMADYAPAYDQRWEVAKAKTECRYYGKNDYADDHRRVYDTNSTKTKDIFSLGSCEGAITEKNLCVYFMWEPLGACYCCSKHTALTH